MQASESERRSAMADGSWMAWTAAGIAGIWVAVALISIFAPDMVSGSEHQHLPVAALGSWFWGLIATGAFIWGMGRLRGSAARRAIWTGLTAATLIVWLVATIASIALPVVETGSDPTRLPIGAMVAPVAATVLTALAPAVWVLLLARMASGAGRIVTLASVAGQRSTSATGVHYATSKAAIVALTRIRAWPPSPAIGRDSVTRSAPGATRNFSGWPVIMSMPTNGRVS